MTQDNNTTHVGGPNNANNGQTSPGNGKTNPTDPNKPTDPTKPTKPTKPTDGDDLPDPPNPPDDEEFPDDKPLALEAILPPYGDVVGGEEISFILSQQDSSTKVFIDKTEAKTTWDGSRLIVEVPPFKLGRNVDSRTVDVKVETDNGESIEQSQAFTYYTTRSISRVVPSAVAVGEPSRITLTGTGFTESTRIEVGGIEVPSLEFVDREHLVFVAPTLEQVARGKDPLNAKRSVVTYPITIVDEFGSRTTNQSLGYFKKIEVGFAESIEVDPSASQSVVFKGSGFTEGMTFEIEGPGAVASLRQRQSGQVESVSEDGTEATLLVQAFSGQIPHGAATVTFSNIVDTLRLENAIYLSSQPVTDFEILRVSRDKISEMGGRVELQGPNVGPNVVSITFDGKPITLTKTSKGYVDVMLPAYAPGSYNLELRVMVNGIEQARKTTITVVATPKISSITPAKVSSVGGDRIELIGKGFDAAERLTINGVEVPFRRVSDTNIEVFVPPLNKGKADVVISSGAEETSYVGDLVVEEPFGFFTISPQRGATFGKTLVDVYGTGFEQTLEVFFGDKKGELVTLKSPHHAVVSIPQSTSGVVVVKAEVVGENGKRETASKTAKFQYYEVLKEGGGSSGGVIEGAINVTVISSTGHPVKGALVAVSGSKETPYHGTTDSYGTVTIRGEELYGPQSVHVTAYGFSSASVFDVNARNVTIILNLLDGFYIGKDGEITKIPPPEDPEDPPPGGGTQDPGNGTNPTDPSQEKPLPVVQGRLIGLDKITVPGPNEHLRCYIFTTRVDPRSNNPNPGPRSVLTADGNFQITTRTGTLAVIAIGGLYNTAEKTFTPLVMGTIRNLSLARGDVVTHNMVLDIPTQTSYRLKVDGVPTIAPYVLAIPLINLGSEGVFSPMVSPSGSGVSALSFEHQPYIKRDIPGASYDINVIASMLNNPSSVPRTFSRVRGVVPVPNGEIKFPGLYSIASVTNLDDLKFGSGYGKVVSFDLDSPGNPPDIFYVKIFSLKGEAVWELILPGTARSFQLPHFPASSHGQNFNPYPPGEYRFIIYGLAYDNFQYNNLNYSNLLRSSSLIGHSIFMGTVRFSASSP